MRVQAGVVHACTHGSGGPLTIAMHSPLARVQTGPAVAGTSARPASCTL